MPPFINGELLSYYEGPNRENIPQQVPFHSNSNRTNFKIDPDDPSRIIFLNSGDFYLNFYLGVTSLADSAAKNSVLRFSFLINGEIVPHCGHTISTRKKAENRSEFFSYIGSFTEGDYASLSVISNTTNVRLSNTMSLALDSDGHSIHKVPIRLRINEIQNGWATATRKGTVPPGTDTLTYTDTLTRTSSDNRISIDCILLCARCPDLSGNGTRYHLNVLQAIRHSLL
jgi:hypothetical protein